MRTTTVSLPTALSIFAAAVLAASPAAHAQGMLLASAAVTAAPTALATPAAKTAEAEAAARSEALNASPISLAVHNGVLRVDGFTAKLRLNADIDRAAYLSVFLPGTGTVTISLAPTPGSEFVPRAFHGNRLEFRAAGRDYAIVSSKPLMDADAYVRLDTSTADLSGQPLLSYGTAETFGQPWPAVAGQAVVVDRSLRPAAVDSTAPAAVDLSATATQQGSAE